MMTRAKLGLLLAGLVIAPLTSAHHSYTAFDSAKTRTLEGTVSTVDWVNPHVTFMLLVPTAGSPPEVWRIESSSPLILARYGWTRTTLQPGEKVSVVCNPMSDGSNGGRLHTVLFLKTGKTLETKLSASLKSSEN